MQKRYILTPLAALVLLAPPRLALAQTTGKVGIGTTAPTQTLDVNGQVRVRGLSGSDTRLPVVLPDGTLGANAPVYSSAATALDLPTAAASTTTTATGPYHVVLSGSLAFVVNYTANRLQIFDVSNPAAPVLRSTTTTATQPRSVAVSGTTAYVLNVGSNNMQLFDVSNPAAPVLRSTTTTGTEPYSVAVSGTTAYVVNYMSNTLQVFDASNPAAPVLRGSTATGNRPFSVAVSGGLAYVTNSQSYTLQVYDVSNPTSPTSRGTVATNALPRSVAVSGTTAYVVNTFDDSLQLFDVSNPASPVLLGRATTNDAPYAVAVDGTTAYVVNYNDNTLQVFDASTPTAPVLRATLPTGTQPRSVAVSGATAYVANLGSSTLQVFTLGLTRTVVVNPDGSLASVPLPNPADVVKNQTAAVQAGGFNVGGNAYVGGNVGVGTTAPTQKLQVAGQIFSSTGGFRFPDNTVQTTAGVASGSAVLNQTTLQSGASFNVGGTGTVGGPLSAGSLAARGNDPVTNQGAYVQWNRSGNQGETWLLNQNGRGVGGIAFGQSDAVPPGLGVNNTVTEWARFSGSGNLGLGTSSPSQKLDVRGNLRLGDDGGNVAATGQAIEFVGPGLNTDPLGLYRVNTAVDQSQLRVVVGDAPDANDKFVVGYTSGSGEGQLLSGTFTPQFSVSSAGQVSAAALAGTGTRVVVADASGTLGTITSAGDNLGNHTATQNLSLATYQLVGNGGSQGLSISNTGNVGIGTTTPGHPLTVQAGAASNSPLLGFYSQAGADKYNFSLAGGGLNLSESGVAGGRLFVQDATGNVGIGTTTPGQKLEVAGGIKFTGAGSVLTFPDGTTQTTANLSGDITSSGNATTYATVVPASKGGAGTVSGLLKANGSGTVSQAVAGTDYLTPAAAGTSYIQNSSVQQSASFNISGNGYVGGNVGIGTTGPSQKLDVRGNLRLGADGGNVTGLGQTIEFVGPGLNTDPVGLYRVNPAADASELRVVVGDASDANDRFSVGRTSASTEGALAAGTFTPAFTVRADGNVGIGTAAPQAGLHVDRPESGSSTALGVLLGGGTSGNPSIELRGTSSSPYIDFSENPNLDYSTRLISQSGTLSLLYGNPATKPANLLNVDGGLRATAFNTTSDARFKTNVRPLTGALASVLALRGVRYEWNTLGVKHGGTAGAPQVGVLAQEVEKIYPELVSTDKDGYKAVNYAQLTPVLLEALKEQQAQIDALKVEAAAAQAALRTVQTQATADKAQATAALETFEARLRRLEAGPEARAQR